MKEKIFKIMAERNGIQLKPIPLRVILPHELQARRNHGGQSLIKLDERGGLSPKEALHVLKDIDWYDNDESKRIMLLTCDEADRELRVLVRERYLRLRAEEEGRQFHVACSHPERPKDASRGVVRCQKCRGLVEAGA